MKRIASRAVLAAVVLLVPATSLANGPQRISPPRPGPAAEVTIEPALHEPRRTEKRDVFKLRVAVEPMPRTSPGCARAAYFGYTLNPAPGTTVVIPLEVSVAPSAAGPGLAPLLDPFADRPLAIRIRESDKAKLRDFIARAPETERPRLERGISRSLGEPLTLLVMTPEQLSRCFRLEITPVPARAGDTPSPLPRLR